MPQRSGRIGEQRDPHRIVKMLIDRALSGLRRAEIGFTGVPED